jgi:CRP/FNR family transcriptional regulator, anaerobic regulatory protein
VTELSCPRRNAIPLGQSQQWIRDEVNAQSSLTEEWALGRRKLTAAFRTLPQRTLKSDKLLAIRSGDRSAIFRLRAGWACQFCDLSNGRSVIIDVYLPGDVIGLDTLLSSERLPRILTLTSVTLEVIPAESGFLDLMADRSIAIYIFWLLRQRQRRADRRLIANTRFEAQARLAVMLLDFYTRLRRRKLITGSTYNLPLTQTQIGDYAGLSAVHVNRVLRSLRDEGIVNVEKNCVTILDLKHLTRLAQDGEVVNSALTSADAAAELSLPTLTAGE